MQSTASRGSHCHAVAKQRLNLPGNLISACQSDAAKTTADIKIKFLFVGTQN